MEKSIILILDNIRSVHNVGSLFRTSDGVGVGRLFLCGTTPTPVDRFGRKRSDFTKVSLGAEDSLSWEYFASAEEALIRAKEENYFVLALEQSENSLTYDTLFSQEKIALILGTEVTGLPKEIIQLCDAVIEIPMRGKKESLNVSVAGGIALYELTKKK